MDYEKKYKEAQKWIESIYSELSHEQQMEAVAFFPELSESEDELTWLTKYIKEEAYSLSMDIRDNEDRIKLKNLQRSLDWLEKQSSNVELSDGINIDKQKLVEWSEEDEKILKDILVDVKFEGYNNDMLANSYKKINWLKSLKEKFKTQTRQGISKEDEYSFMLISGLIRQDQDLSPENKNKLRLWLKSIIYQSRWKPSDEQITVLELASKYERVFTPKQIDILIGLKEQLKKLRGE